MVGYCQSTLASMLLPDESTYLYKSAWFTIISNYNILQRVVIKQIHVMVFDEREGADFAK